MLARFAVAVLAPLLANWALAGPCTVPPFESFEQNAAVRGKPPDSSLLEVDMQPVATVMLPGGFSKLGALPYGSVGFGGHPSGMAVVLSFETEQTVSVHRKDATPAAFILSIFKGLDSVGCEYMEAQRLADEDYRLYGRLEKGAELFAYGKSDTHKFYVVRPDKPHVVLNGLVKRVSRSEFEAILSSIAIK